MIYLDYQATTPLAPEALDAMIPWLRSQHDNPHSAHPGGRAAKAMVETSRAAVAALLPAGGTLSFTSGATEAINWAIKGSSGAIVTIATEHAATLDSATAVAARGRRVTLLPVRRDGLIDPTAAAAAIDGPTGLVAAMLVNNEIGVIQPIAQLVALARAADALLLCDAVQGFGRVPIPAGCDLIALSAHKIHGPKGIGALWIRDGVTLDPLLDGGGQEAAGRSGTLSPALCAGFGAAAHLAAVRREIDAAHVAALQTAALEGFGADWIVNGSLDSRYAGNLNLRRDGLDAARLMSTLRGIAMSAGSACASGSGRPSHVLEAIGLTRVQAHNSLRVGFGRYTAEAELREAIALIVAAADAQRVTA